MAWYFFFSLFQFAKLGSCSSCWFSCLSRPLRHWRQIRREFVTFHRKVPLPGPVQDPQGFRPVGAANSFLKIFLRAQRGKLFRQRDINELIQGYAFRFRHLTRLLHQRRLQAQRKIISSHKFGLHVWCSASLGKITAQSNSLLASLKSRWLKVTMASAFPLTAVSRTISSFASDSLGRQRNASLTCLATDARSSRTRWTSFALNPHAARCSGRVRTASYSIMRGTESNTSKRRSSAPCRSRRDAPRALRKAATSTSVSST
jgi:hypothetical protein